MEVLSVDSCKIFCLFYLVVMTMLRILCYSMDVISVCRNGGSGGGV